MQKAMIIGGVVVAVMMLMAGLAVTTLIAAVVMMSDSRGERIEFKNGELFYTENVQSSEAHALAQFLEQQYGELENQKTFQVDRRGSDVIVKMCAQSSTWETDELDYSFRALEMMIQHHVFTEDNVVVELCDRYLNPMKMIDSIPAAQIDDMPRYGEPPFEKK